MTVTALIRVWCFLFRWKVVRTEHEIPRPCVVVAAPHTSNWDFFALIATTRLNDVDMRWLGKRQMFDGPLGSLFRALGGIPVDRAAPGGVVGEMVQMLDEDPDLVVVVPAEGTRSATEYWKSGFHRIAREAGVPIQMAYVDARSRTSGFGPSLLASGDVSADMDVIRAFYADKTGIKPDRFLTPCLREETSAEAA
ncbi:MAG: 1-acyl-sn-glycerol-3-phosphate acyltransferase [Microthrixaceae bacterium]|nr:1-acyl-sn-glycerol-3-phosphate acyltransferase [Microthrixaceae bacterium]